MDSIDAPPKLRQKASPKRARSQAKITDTQTPLQARIAINAYYKAEARGFLPGYELQDWLAAEEEEAQR